LWGWEDLTNYKECKHEIVSSDFFPKICKLCGETIFEKLVLTESLTTQDNITLSFTDGVNGK